MAALRNDRVAELENRLRSRAQHDREEIEEIVHHCPEPPVTLGETLEDIANIYLDCSQEISHSQSVHRPPH